MDHISLAVEHSIRAIDVEPDQDFGDDGRENAVDEDALNAEDEDDLSEDDESLTAGESETIREGLAR